MEKFEIHGSNDTTSTLIARKCTLAGALIFASEILDCWDDVLVREQKEEGALLIARLSAKGLII